MDYSPEESSSVHPNSLVDPSLHSQSILDLINLKLTPSLIGQYWQATQTAIQGLISIPFPEYVVDCVVETVHFAMGHPSTSSGSRGRSQSRRSVHENFTTFVTNVIARTEVNMPTVLAALVYIDRAKPHLDIALEEWALERVFLGALMVAMKYLNDSTLKNVHVSLCTGVFSRHDTMRVEREFLSVLNWELGVSEADILSHHAGISAIVNPRVFAPVQTSFPRTHRHRHHHRNTHMPELEPSSPSSTTTSSTCSSEPRTPPSAEHSTTLPAPPKSVAYPAPRFFLAEKQRSSASHVADLIRSFPMPSVPRPKHQTHQHRPMRATLCA